MRRVQHHSGLPQSGQGTVEYLLLTALVVGIMLTIFNGPLRRFLAEYQARKSEYTNVVAQRNMGIPMQWFGGSYPRPGTTAGGATAGGVNAGGDNAGGPEGPGTTAGGDPTANTPGGTNAGRTNAGGSNAGEGTPGGELTPGGAAGNNAGNNSLLGSDGRNTANNRGGRGGRTNSGDGEGEEGGDVNSGGTVTGRSSNTNQVRGDGGLNDEAPPNETEEEKALRLKKLEGGDTLESERELYGSNQRKKRDGGCAEMDLKTILQIIFVLGLLFLLASLLFQKRGGDE